MAWMIGQRVRITGIFTNSTGGAVNPSVGPVLVLRLPSSSNNIYTYGTDTTILVMDSSGNFHLDYTWLSAGTHLARWESSGDLITVSNPERTFVVRPSQVRTT